MKDLWEADRPLRHTDTRPVAPPPSGGRDEVIWLTPEEFMQVVAAGPKAMARVLSRYVRPETGSDTLSRSRPTARAPKPPRRGPTVPVAILDLDDPARVTPRALPPALSAATPPPAAVPLAPEAPTAPVPESPVGASPPQPSRPATGTTPTPPPAPAAAARPQRKPQQAFIEVLLIGFMITLAVAASYLVMHWMGFAGFLTSFGQ